MMDFARYSWMLVVLHGAVGCAGDHRQFNSDSGLDVQRSDLVVNRDRSMDTNTDTSAIDGGVSVDVTLIDTIFPTDLPMMDVRSDQPMFDAPVNNCSSLAEQYASVIAAARSCISGQECGVLVCETPCCNCEVFVRGEFSVMNQLRLLQQTWDSAGCNLPTFCGGPVCGPAIRAECSTGGLCVTVRRTVNDQ